MSLLAGLSDLWTPPPDLTISEWADAYRHIPPEASAEPGRWHTDRAPYQRAMLDSICTSERTVMMTAAQIGKTEILLNVLGYYIDKEPAPILLLQPTLEMAESFSKERFAPMIRDTPCLTGRIADPKSRTSGNTLLHKKFDGGHITLAGANSPASLASRPVRILLCDEVDHYPESAGAEGDPVALATARTQNFWNRKIIYVSTPTNIKTSKILKEFEQTDKSEWEIPCPSCGNYCAFNWNYIEYRDLTEPLMECPACHKRFGEHDWKKAQTRGRWHATVDSPIRGFHMNAFASPWVSWVELIRRYEKAYKGGDQTLKVWTNTVLGQPYENLAEIIDIEGVMESVEEYHVEIPEDVLILTCGVDVQDDRLELEVVGWGLYKESWGIEYRVLYGDPGSPELWEELDAYLSRTWKFADGSETVIACTCIDSAGHFTGEVYKFVKGKSRRNIYAIVGRGRFGMACVSKPSRSNRARIPLFTLGVSTLKGMIYSWLNARRNQHGYCHFPKGNGYDELYFKGLMSERMVTRRKNGQEYVTWEVRSDKVRNEPLDCRVYALGALELLNPDLKARAKKREALKAPAKSKRKMDLKPKRTSGFLRKGLSL